MNFLNSTGMEFLFQKLGFSEDGIFSKLQFLRDDFNTIKEYMDRSETEGKIFKTNFLIFRYFRHFPMYLLVHG